VHVKGRRSEWSKSAPNGEPGCLCEWGPYVICKATPKRMVKGRRSLEGRDMATGIRL